MPAIFALFLSAPLLGTPFQTTEVAKFQDVVWGIAVLPDQRLVVNLRGGRMMLTSNAAPPVEVTGLPPIFRSGQGGLLDVVADPNFANNSLIYFTYSVSRADRRSTTAIARAKLRDTALTDLQVLAEADAWSDNTVHYGSRIAFAEDRHLFWSVGDRNERHKAQDPQSHFGKVLRQKLDGPNTPTVFARGTRNIQGMVYDAAKRRLLTVEHGPRGGDEINLIAEGKNYGWPVVTFGREYWGPRIGDGTTKEGMEGPLKQWTPSIAPGGMLLYTADMFPEWKSHLFVTALSGQYVARLKWTGTDLGGETKMLADLGERFRAITQDRDGSILIGTDSGKLLRLHRKPAPSKK
jgi:glucose/arabinose dehydrogenase